MAKNTHKGIIYGAGISYRGTAFNFTRDYYDTFADLEAEKNNWSIYFPKYFITNVGGTLYQYDGTNFNKFLTSGSNYASAEDLKNLQNTHAQDQQANEVQLQDLTTNINELSEEATAQQAAIDEKVDKVAGKGLSTNDYTTDEKNKLAGIAAGAQVNVIESVNVNGTAQTISNKEVDISVPTNLSQLINDIYEVATSAEITAILN